MCYGPIIIIVGSNCFRQVFKKNVISKNVRITPVQVDRSTLNTITSQVLHLSARDMMSLWRLYVKVNRGVLYSLIRSWISDMDMTGAFKPDGVWDMAYIVRPFHYRSIIYKLFSKTGATST